MNKLPKGCIFDLDGVICDTAKYHFLAWKKLAERLEIPFTEKENEMLKGVSRIDSLKILLSLKNILPKEDELLRLADLKNNWYREYIQQITPDELLEGVLEFIVALKSHNIKIALGSVSKNAPDILNSLNITQYFDAVIDGNRVSHAKPDPEVFLSGASELMLDPKSCLVFEDAISGVKAAHNAGMKCIGIGDSSILSEADYVIPGFRDFSYRNLEALPFSFA